ncbi:MAG: peptidase M14, partial [Robiginitalea sp.]
LSQPESILLRKVFDDFKPHFCFNLHDQRTIYSVGDSPVPATLSLLAPALDTERSFTGNRIKAAQLSSLVAASLKDVIGIARYNDTFNQNCAGDYFQSRGVPTVLFEAGHFPGDYQRETTRFYVWQALLTALDAISSRAYEKFSLDAYVEIPENQKRFADILIRNAQITHPDLPANCTLGIQYEEKLSEGHVEFCPRIAELGESGRRFGHLEWDLSRPRDMKKLIKSE